MQSRRDQVQAQTYVLGRLTSALVHGEPDAAETPMRRTTIGLFAGLMIAAIIVAGSAVIGLIFPSGGTRWQQPGMLVVEKETGSRYLYLAGRLHPVLNLASAMLLTRGDLHLEAVPARARS